MHSILIRLILVFMGSFVIALGSVLMIIVPIWDYIHSMYLSMH